MNKDKALESVNEIKELMEKSSKFISLSGLAAIMAGIYALAGAYIATEVITPGTHLIVALELMAIIAALVLVAAAVTACILSYYKSKKTGQKFFSRLTYRALWNFSLPMLTGGVLCISILMHEYYDILASVMLFILRAGIGQCFQVYLFQYRMARLCLHLSGRCRLFLGRSFTTVLDHRFRRFPHPLWYIVLFTLRKKKILMIEAFQYINKAFESKVRLGIMAILMVNEEADFNFLKEQLSLTDGNLASHTRALEELGYIVCNKSFVGRKPRTVFQATLQGREAFKSHIEALEKFLKSK